jgi:hypothetical protein
MPQRLPVLDAIRIASPCSESWDRMVGTERVRNCASCRLDVYNLSAMTRAEAEALLASRTGRLCARYYRRVDGTILTADCPVGVRRRRRQVIATAALGGAASLLALTGMARRFEPRPAEGPRAPSFQIVEPVAMAEREVQPEPQRVQRARLEMYDEPRTEAIEAAHTVGILVMPEHEMGDIASPLGSEK